MKNGHHANLLVGGADEAELIVRSYAKNLGAELANNPDFIVLKSEVFGIDEARELKRLATRIAIAGFKIFLVIPEKITLEAQNALLKIFEDPTPGTYFFLATKDKGSIIPTLLSRMNVMPAAKGESRLKESKDFLGLPLKKRLIVASNFVEDKSNLIEFLDSLMLGLKERGETNSLRKVYEIRRLVLDKNMGARLVIEHLALVL